MWRRLHPILFPVLVIVVLSISPPSASAIPIMDPLLDLPTSLMLTGTLGEWKLTWTDPTLKLFWDGNRARPAIRKDVIFKTLDPITIEFEQTKPASDVGMPDIRFFIDEDRAKNETPKDWNDFHLTLKDLTPQIAINHQGPDPDHPAPPHFHSRRLGANLTVDKLKFLAGADKARPTASSIDFGDGLVRKGETLTMRAFVIHEWMVEINQAADNTKLRKV